MPIGDGELRGVNRVAVEKKKIGGSGRKGEKPPQGANLEVLILGEREESWDAEFELVGWVFIPFDEGPGRRG